MDKITIYIDGGSRGNPGPAALGAVFTDEKGSPLKSYSQFLGEATNNTAEYSALIFALRKAKALFGREKIKKLSLEIRSDSELLIKQMKGEYKIKTPATQKLFIRAWNLRVDFKDLKFSLISREENKLADRLVNEVLDEEAKKQKLL